MSLFGSLNASVTALRTQSDALGIISDNIANVNNFGYKKRNATFESLVTQQNNAGGFSPGGVRINPVHEIGAQGQLESSDFATDLAIEGNGFFAVRSNIGNVDDNPLVYTRDGQFRVNDEGNLENASGYLLHGWEIDGQGNLPADLQSPASLSTVNVNGFSGIAKATENISIGANLPATATDTVQDATATDQSLQTMSVRVFDSEGTAHNLQVEFSRQPDPANIDAANPPALLPNNVWRITIRTPTLAEGTNAGQFSGLFDVDTNDDGTNDATASQVTTYARFNGDGSIQSFAQIDVANNAVGFNDDNTNPDLGDPGDTTFAFDSTAVDLDGSGNTVNAATLSGDAFRNVSLNFTQDFTTATNTPDVATGPGATAALAGPVSVPAATDADTTALSLDLGTPSDPDNDGTDDNDRLLDGLTQFDTGFQVNEIEQDGLQFGAFNGVTVDEEGIVTAHFDNGQRRDIYKLPVVNFQNPNGLTAKTGDVFAESSDSGVALLNEAGEGGAGSIAPGAREASTVDLATEFTDMIETQRAYSATTRVITASDEMLQELTNTAR